MMVPYKSQYRNPLRRLTIITLVRLHRILGRPVLQLGGAALVILLVTLWLHERTPVLQGGGVVQLHAALEQTLPHKAS